MSGAATTAQWLTCAAIGTGSTGAVLLLLKLALDAPPSFRVPRPQPVPPRPAATVVVRCAARHAGPPAVDETQPITRVRPHRARHSKGQPTWT